MGCGLRAPLRRAEEARPCAHPADLRPRAHPPRAHRARQLASVDPRVRPAAPAPLCAGAHLLTPPLVRRRNVKHALALVNVVADSRYRLYDDFSNQDGRRLGDYLGAVRQAVLAGLEGGGSDPFRVLAV